MYWAPALRNERDRVRDACQRARVRVGRAPGNRTRRQGTVPAPRARGMRLDQTAKNFKLDLFTLDDGHFEYYAVATNMTLGLSALFAFVCGRGAQEKTLAELKGEFALDVVPTNHYGANSAWQQLSILVYNLSRNFQLDTLTAPKPRSRKRTYAYLLRSMRTLRFLLIARARRPPNPDFPKVSFYISLQWRIDQTRSYTAVAKYFECPGMTAVASTL